MVNFKYISLLVLFVLSLSTKANDIELNQKEPVLDLTETLQSSELKSLNRKIGTFTEEKGSQIVVIMIPSTDGHAIESVSMELAEAWKLGREGVDDGVLILIAKDDRKMRIEVGYGLEGAITDIYAKRLIENVFTPKFKTGNYKGGINDGLDGIIQLINKEELPGVTELETKTGGSIIAWVVFGGMLVGIFFFFRGWWKRITYYCYEDTFLLKVKYIFVQFKWDWMAFILQTVILTVIFTIKRGDFLDGLENGLMLSALFFGFYFIVRGYLAGPTSGGSSYSSGSSYSGSSSSYSSSSSSSSSYSGGGGSFGGGGASGSW
jgi:uncharacterized protein